MKKYLVFAMASILALSACGKKADDAKSDDAKAEAAAEAPADAAKPAFADAKDIEKAEARKLIDGVELTRDGLNSILKEDGKMSPIEYEAILLARTRCKYNETEKAYDKECPVDEVEDLGGFVRRRTIGDEARHEVLSRLSKHPDRGARSAAIAQLLEFASNTKEDKREPLVTEALGYLKNEKDPIVLASALNKAGFSNSVRSFRDWRRTMMEHPESIVRRNTVTPIFNFIDDNDEKQATLKLFYKLLDDSDNDTASYACSNIGSAYDTAAVKVISDHIMGSEDRLDKECFRALVDMWGAFVLSDENKEAAKAAYDATINYLKITPRNDKKPNAFALDLSMLPNREKLEEFKSERPFVNVQDFIAPLTDIVNDKDVSWFAKASAVKTLGNYGGVDALKAVESAVKASNENALKGAFEEAMRNAGAK